MLDTNTAARIDHAVNLGTFFDDIKFGRDARRNIGEYRAYLDERQQGFKPHFYASESADVRASFSFDPAEMTESRLDTIIRLARELRRWQSIDSIVVDISGNEFVERKLVLSVSEKITYISASRPQFVIKGVTDTPNRFVGTPAEIITLLSL